MRYTLMAKFVARVRLLFCTGAGSSSQHRFSPLHSGPPLRGRTLGSVGGTGHAPETCVGSDQGLRSPSGSLTRRRWVWGHVGQRGSHRGWEGVLAKACGLAGPSGGRAPRAFHVAGLEPRRPRPGTPAPRQRPSGARNHSVTRSVCPWLLCPRLQRGWPSCVRPRLSERVARPRWRWHPASDLFLNELMRDRAGSYF